MCGITGLANLNQTMSLGDYYATHLRLRHRGLDDEGFFVVHEAGAGFYRGDDTIPEFGTLPHIRQVRAAQVVLGHRRLSIIDLSPGGHQPMCDVRGRYTIVYNGEIFNYIELREELEGLGHRFNTQSDTEVLLAAFAQWGPRGFNRLNGMWALAIYDASERKLILSRDRFGIKPLYYAFHNGTLYFGSEVKFLLPYLASLRINEARAMEYLVHNLVDHHVETMFEDVYQLLPAHYAVLDRTGLSQSAYWHLPDQQVELTLDAACEQLQQLLTSAVALRLRSDVPIGSLLSGGLDSTTIVCIVRQLLDQQDADNTFEFFSAVFKEESFSERRYIEDTVVQTGMPIHWIYPDPERLLETLPQLLYHQEFPFRSLAVYSQWEIMRHVRQTPTVVLLNGQGSDEVFAGYTAHHYALIAEYLRRVRPAKAWTETCALTKAREISLIQAIVGSLRELIKGSALKGLVRYRPLPYLNRPYRPATAGVWQHDVFRNALARNLTFSALPEYLRYEDRNSMAFTLESRLPFMDYRLVEWAMSLPLDLKVDRAISKRVLREMARPLIPLSVTGRRDKMGFVSPQELWQHNVLKSALDTVFEQDLCAIFPFLNNERTNRIYQAYQSGHNNHWTWVWRVACMYWWHRAWWGAWNVN